MTEAERYEKTLYRPSTTSQKSKKRNPQEEWTQLISRAAAAAESSSPFHRPLSTLASLGNVPRKETQFRNFALNSLGNSILGNRQNNLEDKKQKIQDLWNYLIQCRDSERKESQVINEISTNKDTDTVPVSIKKLDQDTTSLSTNANKTTLQQTSIENKETDHASFTTQPDKSLSTLPSTQKIRKAMLKILKKTNTLKFKKLRLQICQKLKLDPLLQKSLKPLLQKELGSQDSKIQMKGKIVQLIS
jgi:hypothetical protein